MARWQLAAVAAMLLTAGGAGSKVHVAFLRDKHNVIFLIAAALVFTLLLFGPWLKRTTGLGRATLTRLRDKFRTLKSRAKSIRSGSATNGRLLSLPMAGPTYVGSKRASPAARKRRWSKD